MHRLRPIVDFLDNYWMYLVIGVCLFVLGIVRIVVKFKRDPQVEMRDITMTIEGRKLHVERVELECICDGLLNAVLDGRIDAQEANVAMAKIAKALKREDLMPLIRERKPAILKADLRNKKRRRQLNGGHDKPVLLPQPKIDKPVDEDSIAAILNRS
jgi:hypothetical protein